MLIFIFFIINSNYLKINIFLLSSFLPVGQTRDMGEAVEVLENAAV